MSTTRITVSIMTTCPSIRKTFMRSPNRSLILISSRIIQGHKREVHARHFAESHLLNYPWICCLRSLLSVFIIRCLVLSNSKRNSVPVMSVVVTTFVIGKTARREMPKSGLTFRWLTLSNLRMVKVMTTITTMMLVMMIRSKSILKSLWTSSRSFWSMTVSPALEFGCYMPIFGSQLSLWFCWNAWRQSVETSHSMHRVPSKWDSLMTLWSFSELA